ncbi:glycosyltransferase [Patescibacteria group bacterium]
MRVLMFTTDKNILQENSEVSQRMVEYSKLVEKLDILLIQKSNILSALKRGKKYEKPDLISAQDPFETGFIGWKLARYFGAKLQLQVHTDFMSPYFKKESLKNRVRVWLAKFLIPKANCIRVVSERIRKSLELRFKNYDLGITNLPIWVDVEKIKNSPIKIDLHKKYPQFDFIILMASRLTKEKNISTAITTMSDVVVNYPKTGLIIVGDGSQRKALKSQITRYKLQNNAILEQWTTDLTSYYKTCDLFLLTSNYEGYGMTLIEASAAGCNIISTDVGIADEVLEKENIFRQGDKKGLQTKIERALNGNIKPTKQINSCTRKEYLEKYRNMLYSI